MLGNPGQIFGTSTDAATPAQHRCKDLTSTSLIGLQPGQEIGAGSDVPTDARTCPRNATQPMQKPRCLTYTPTERNYGGRKRTRNTVYKLEYDTSRHWRVWTSGREGGARRLAPEPETFESSSEPEKCPRDGSDDRVR